MKSYVIDSGPTGETGRKGFSKQDLEKDTQDRYRSDIGQNVRTEPRKKNNNKKNPKTNLACPIRYLSPKAPLNF